MQHYLSGILSFGTICSKLWAGGVYDKVIWNKSGNGVAHHDCTGHICWSRGLERDKPNATTRELNELWRLWTAEEEDYFDRGEPIEFANVVVDGSVPFELG
jgi:hypothetical protein